MRRLPLAEAVLLALTVAWGLSFVLIRRTLVGCGPLTLTSLRMAVGVACLLALRPRAFAATALEWRAGVLGGTMIAVGYVLQTAGLMEASSGKSGFLTSFYVALVPLIGAVVTRKWPANRDLLALAVASTGIALLTLHEDLTLSSGEGLVAVAAFFWAAQIVIVGRVADRVDPIRIAAIQLLTVLVVALLGRAVLPAEPSIAWTPEFVGIVLFLGVATNALGFLGQAWAQRLIPPTRTAILFSPEPVFAAIFGWWLADEALGPREWAGSALVMTAVALTIWKPGKAASVGPVV